MLGFGMELQIQTILNIKDIFYINFIQLFQIFPILNGIKMSGRSKYFSLLGTTELCET